MGRPLKLSLEIQEGMASLVREGNPAVTSAEILGISRSTYFNWMKKGEEGEAPFLEFSDSIKRAFAESIAQHAAHISRVALSGDWRASAWLLERLDPENFGKQRIHDLDFNRPESASITLKPLITVESLEEKIQQIQSLRVNSQEYLSHKTDEQ